MKKVSIAVYEKIVTIGEAIQANERGETVVRDGDSFYTRTVVQG